MIRLAQWAGCMLAGWASSMFAWCLLDVCYALCMLHIFSIFARSCKWGINHSLECSRWVVAYGLWGEDMWLIGRSAWCKPWVKLFADVGNGWSHNALQYHQLMPISCHFQDCKALLVLSPSHVRNAIASTGLYLFKFLKWMVNKLMHSRQSLSHSFHAQW